MGRRLNIGSGCCSSSGIAFAAPGAVYIHGNYISREQNGKISLAGPATNIILRVVLFAHAIFGVVTKL